ncbi:MAG: hypothetical protein CV087_07470 [Candidatus Brocadia sp. WS118]|nr:MAG: hypothetical protein CV087_07470 [Candidatus Brocadia sp. WS118]
MIYGMRDENWREFIEKMNSGEKCEITEEVFDYFLDALPPKFMYETVELVSGEKIRADFGFAEGWETITAFWKKAGHFFCQQTILQNRD